MSKIKNVLFLCSGNTCRSPFAEYFSKWLQKTKYASDIKDLNFDSAGIYHYYEKPQEGTLKYLTAKGIEMDDFEAKDVDEELLNKQDLILAFEEKYHIRKLKRKFRNLKDLDEKLILLLKFAGETENFEIEDPFYLEENEYNAILKRIETGIIKSIEKIIKINNSK
ncbi:MAG: arsenate reductase/protein-tyrosine-phosphatase family protein [Promethearchaeota archaeon]|jgi:protein-tyrosine-phosphatase